MKVTAWSVKTKDGFVHNHIEDGWVPHSQKKPLGHKSWSGKEWKKEYGHLIGSKFERV